MDRKQLLQDLIKSASGEGFNLKEWLTKYQNPIYGGLAGMGIGAASSAAMDLLSNKKKKNNSWLRHLIMGLGGGAAGAGAGYLYDNPDMFDKKTEPSSELSDEERVNNSVALDMPDEQVLKETLSNDNNLTASEAVGNIKNTAKRTSDSLKKQWAQAGDKIDEERVNNSVALDMPDEQVLKETLSNDNNLTDKERSDLIVPVINKSPEELQQLSKETTDIINIAKVEIKTKDAQLQGLMAVRDQLPQSAEAARAKIDVAINRLNTEISGFQQQYDEASSQLRNIQKNMEVGGRLAREQATNTNTAIVEKTKVLGQQLTAQFDEIKALQELQKQHIPDVDTKIAIDEEIRKRQEIVNRLQQEINKIKGAR
jgi:hypothetical protein